MFSSRNSPIHQITRLGHHERVYFNSPTRPIARLGNHELVYVNSPIHPIARVGNHQRVCVNIRKFRKSAGSVPLFVVLSVTETLAGRPFREYRECPVRIQSNEYNKPPPRSCPRSFSILIQATGSLTHSSNRTDYIFDLRACP